MTARTAIGEIEGQEDSATPAETGVSQSLGEQLLLGILIPFT